MVTAEVSRKPRALPFIRCLPILSLLHPTRQITFPWEVSIAVLESLCVQGLAPQTPASLGPAVMATLRPH